MPQNKINIQFSNRELEVVQYLLRAKSNKEIAGELGITIRTVESHLSSIYAKLGVNSRTEAALILSEYNLWKSPDKGETNNQGNPQLKTGIDSVTLSTKLIFHSYRPRHSTMKKLTRFCFAILLAILLVILILSVFAFLRQL